MLIHIIKITVGAKLRRNRCQLRLTNEDITIVNSDYVYDEDDVICNDETVQNTDNVEATSDGHDSTIPITRSQYGRIIQPHPLGIMIRNCDCSLILVN